MKWEAQRLLEYLEEASDLYFDSLSQVRMDHWSQGRVVLLGDAASRTSPLAGMGTSIAIVGAYMLAGELRQSGGDYPSAFTRYDAVYIAALAAGVLWLSEVNLFLIGEPWHAPA